MSSAPRAMASTVASATFAGVVVNGAWRRPAVIFVVTKPGRTVSTCTPSSRSANASPSPSASIPAFDEP